MGIVVLKKTLTTAVIKVTGSGAQTITLASLIDTATKPAFFASGVTVITVRDTEGVVIGGKVTGTGIPADTTVTAISQHMVTLSAATTAVANGSYVFESQVATAPEVNISKIQYDGLGDATKVTRNSVDVLSLKGFGSWGFDGFSLNENNTYDIVVNMTAAGTTILELRKVGGYGDSQHPYRN